MPGSPYGLLARTARSVPAPPLGDTRPIPSLLLDDDVESSPPPVALERATLAVVVFTVLLWPLSPLALVPLLGASRCRALLGNLCYLPQTSWVAAAHRCFGGAGRQWLVDRWWAFIIHHVTTALFASAVAAWAASGGTTAGALMAGTPAAAVSRAMLGFQLISSGAALLTRRLAFATALTRNIRLSSAPSKLMRAIAHSDVPPLFTVSRISLQADGAALTNRVVAAMVYSMSLWLHLPTSSHFLSAKAYTVLRAYALAQGLSGAPPLACVRSAPDATLRLPTGRVAARCTPAPSWRASVVRYLLPDGVEGDVPAEDVETGSLIIAADIHAITRLRYVSKVGAIGAGVAAAAVVAAAVPWIVRASLQQVRVIGSSSAEATAFVLLTLLDLIHGLSMRTNGAVTSAALYCYTRAVFAQLHTFIVPPDVGRGGGLADAADTTAATRPDDLPLSAQPRVAWVPMHINGLTPPDLDHAPADAATRARRLRDAVNAQRGSWCLDNSAAVRCYLYEVRGSLVNVSTSGLAHDAMSQGFLAPRVAIITSLTLAILFYFAPQLLTAAYPGLPPAYVAAVQQAALAPTCVMLLSFAVNVCLLLVGFLEVGGIVRELRGMHASVLRWHVATAAAMASAAARRTEMTRRMRAAGCGNAADVELQRRDADDEVWELAAVAEAQRALLLYLVSAMEDDGGIRFLGVFRPGAASVGGLLAVVVSAVVFGVRLASTVSNAQLSP